jgi:diguanylate cyclase (GGDEF)-like protein
MSIKQHLTVRSEVLKGHVNKYTILGLVISLVSIAIASMLVSYQLTGFIDFQGVILAHKTNPALWALDLTPFMFAYWGQSFCYELANTLESMIEDKTRELVNKSSDLELKLQYETNHDHLTNLPNQRLICQRITQGIAQLNKAEELVVIILHINGFKEINYKYGSFNGNSLLIQFAEKLKTILLEPYLLQAYMGMNMVARLQGAEFAILIPRLRREHHLDGLLIKLLAATSTNFMIDGNSINVSTTAGVALYPLHGHDDAALLLHANASLFYAEKEGLSHAIYDETMGKSMDSDHIVLKEVDEAIDNEAISLLFQPEFELKKEKIIGAEAVIHFESLEHGVMAADKLLLILEESSLVKKLTYLMLGKAIKQLAEWQQVNHKIYITVSIFDATDMELPSFIEALLKEHNISAEYLKLEFTEKTCLIDQSRSLTVLKTLAGMGIKLVISDFCSGYTSFIYLTNFPISEIKIDKSFVMNMMIDEKKLSIVRASIKLAATMDLIVFADGIIDQKILKKLKQLGCLYGQGQYFSPPVNADSISASMKLDFSHF